MVTPLISPLTKKLLRDLWRIKSQGLAIALVIGCGVATVVMAFGTLISLQETREAYYERFRFAHVFVPLKRAPERLARDVERIPGVARVSSRIVKDVTLDIPGIGEPAVGRLVSIPETTEPILNNLTVQEGRWILKDKPDEVLISARAATANGFAVGDELGATINGKKRTLTIVGIAQSPEFIYALGPGQMVPDDRTFGIFWMGRSALEAAFDLEESFNDLTLSLRRGANEQDVIERLDILVEPYGGTGAYGREDHMSDAFLRGEMDQLRAMGRIMPPIFLGVAAFLLHVVIGRLIRTEREQIGLLKAFGYSNWIVGWHYVKFVLVLSAIGVLIGTGLGFWMGRWMTGIYSEFLNFPFLYYRADFSIFALGVVVTVGTTLLGTAQTVLRAVRLPPAVAMAPAPPPTYHKSLLEAWGLQRLLTEPTRIILRNLFRWPVRSGLTCLGLAASSGLMVATMFGLDALDQMIDVFYYQSNRQDASITLVDTRARTVLSSIERLPGVLVAEPVRHVPVRLRHEHRSDLLSITGVERDAELSQLLDADLNEVEIPETGLLISTRLAENLAATRGDIITVEVKEGRRPTLELPVTEIVEEYLGTSAYMNLDALNAALGDRPTTNMAKVLLDESHLPSLYTEVKNTPAIASVFLRATTIRSFNETIGENMGQALAFYIFFGSMIAFGVIYNSARIALSERGRELASLRVLGFTRGEVAYILLGELVLLMALSLPIGCALGYGLAAIMAAGLETDLHRIPLVVDRSTYGTAMLVVIFATAISCLIVGRRINNLDLISVLKTRE